MIKVSADQMVVTWTTLDSTADSVVEYGSVPNDLKLSALGSTTVFTDGGSEKRVLYIHRVVLENLIPGQTYCENIFRDCKLQSLNGV